MSIDNKKQSVTCDFCNETHQSSHGRSIAEIRRALKELGWQVAMPLWGWHSPYIPKEEFFAKFPTLKRKTTDCCSPCMNKRCRNVFVTKPKPGLPVELRKRFL